MASLTALTQSSSSSRGPDSFLISFEAGHQMQASNCNSMPL
jgi:hypothetical protein